MIKNPYQWSPIKPDCHDAYERGLADGAKREWRALRRWMEGNCYRYSHGGFMSGDAMAIEDWLASRARKGKKP